MKILHSSDLHLLKDNSPAAQLRFEVFQEICRKAKSVEVLILAGDVFDSFEHTQDSGLAERVKTEFSSIPKTQVLIIPGNHEFLRRTPGVSPYASLVSFGTNALVLFTYPRARFRLRNVEFLGFPFKAGGSTSEAFAGLPASDPGTYRVAVLHGTADIASLGSLARASENIEEGGDMTIFSGDLEAAGIRYAALGHIHKPTLWDLPGGGVAAYPGSPVAVRTTESDERGVNLVELSETDGTVSVSRLPLTSSVRAQRRAFFVVPGVESKVLADIERFIHEQPANTLPVARIKGVGDREKLERGLQALEFKFKGRVKITPDMALGKEEFRSMKEGGEIGMIKDFLDAMAARIEAGVEDPDVLTRAAILGWRVLAKGDADFHAKFLAEVQERTDAA